LPGAEACCRHAFLGNSLRVEREEKARLLQNQNAVIYGGGGAIGGAVARVFARERARVFSAGRTVAKLDRVAGEIAATGGAVEITQLHALDQDA
jgi:short-subunit dehydrogenase